QVAGKLIATAGPVDIGAISVATDASPDGAVPAATHHVVRVRTSGAGFTVGALGTAQRQEGALGHDAVTGGLDGAWRSRDGAFVAAGQLVGTQISSGPVIARPDGTLLHPGDTGLGGTLHVAKEGGWLRGL